jgi:hypothetical protein
MRSRGGSASAALVVATDQEDRVVGPVVYGTLAFGSAVGLLVVASVAHRLDQLPLYLCVVALGWLVGLLDAGPAKMAPEPAIADIADLVDDFVQAGLPVTPRTEGDPGRVSATVGLALYRITQESLANVAKHAPASKATVELVISRPAALLSIVNEMPVAVGAASCDGRGLAGMRQRAELFGGIIDAGPSQQGWSVRAEIPLTHPSPRTRRCPL